MYSHICGAFIPEEKRECIGDKVLFDLDSFCDYVQSCVVWDFVVQLVVASRRSLGVALHLSR